MIDLRRLRGFSELAKQGSFSAAASAMDYTQPALSQQIATLEREIGTALVQRDVRPVRPTPAGAVLLTHATAILDRVALAENQMRTLAAAGSATLRIGSFPTANSTFVPQAMARFLAESPDVSLSLIELEPGDVEQRLMAGDIDLAVVYDFPEYVERRDGRTEYHPLLTEPFSLVTSTADPVVEGPDVTLGDLGPRRFLGTPEGPAADYNALVDGVCAKEGFAPRIIPATNCTDTAQAMVAAGLGVVLLPELALTRTHPDVAVRPVPGRMPTRRILVALQAGAKSPAGERMLRALQESAERSGRLTRARFSAPSASETAAGATP